jgi:hypothetical protein
MSIYAFECSVKDAPWGPTIINSTTAGKAKRQYHRDVSDPWPDVRFIDIRVRKVGAPQTSDAFIRNAKYRGMPDVKCGQRVKVSGNFGWIVGHNSSANFDVLFDSGKWAGATLNVHPSEIALVEQAAAKAASHDTRPLTRCASARDGECVNLQCPQLRDGEPGKSGRHCPLDNWNED